MNLDDKANQVASFVGQAKQTLVTALPSIFTAVIVLIVGWCLAWVLRLGVRRLFRNLAARRDRGLEQPAWSEAVEDPRASNFVANGIYWLVLLTAFAVAIDALGIRAFGKWIALFPGYVPKLIFALAVVFAGVTASRWAGKAIQRAGARLPSAPTVTVVRLTQVSIVVATVLIAAEQLGIDVSLLTDVLLIALAAALGGAALAFGLGARELMADILAMHYVNKSFRIGQVVRMGSDEGRIVRTTSTSVFLENPDGEVWINGNRAGAVFPSGDGGRARYGGCAGADGGP